MLKVQTTTYSERRGVSNLRKLRFKYHLLSTTGVTGEVEAELGAAAGAAVPGTVLLLFVARSGPEESLVGADSRFAGFIESGVVLDLVCLRAMTFFDFDCHYNTIQIVRQHI